MSLVPSNTRKQWRDAVDQLNTDLGTTVRLYFTSGFSSSSDVVSDNGNKPKVNLSFGGKENAFHSTGNDLINNTGEGSDGIIGSEVTKDIVCRVYPLNRKDYELFNIKTQDNMSVYKVITNKKYLPDILRAKYIVLHYNVVNEQFIKTTLISPPVVYGLGEAHQCRFFVQVS